MNQLLWRGPVLDPSGYAEDARQFLRGLREIDYPVTLDPISWSQLRAPLTSEEIHFLESIPKIGSPTSLTPPFAQPFVQIDQVFPQYFHRHSGASHYVGRVLFETDRLPTPWLEPLKALDQIWVASSFNQRTFSASGIPEEKIRILPNAFRNDLFRPEGEKFPIHGRRSFVFLSVFDFSPRKGLDVLLQAWARTFSSKDDVCLVLKTYSSAGRSEEDMQQDILLYLESLHLKIDELAPIILLHPILSFSEMADLFRASDCFVLPTHGEGWGRPFMEALACEVPVIASRWSGHLDFLNDDNSDLIDGNVAPVSEAMLRYNRNFVGHQWFEPRTEHLAELLARTVQQPEAARAKARRGFREMHELFTPIQMARRIQHLLVDLTARG
jgi:glycosyltransferase involved in cell wall biosynthesis